MGNGWLGVGLSLGNLLLSVQITADDGYSSFTPHPSPLLLEVDMVRHRALWLLIATLGLMSLACNAFVGNVEPALQPPPTLAIGEPPGVGTAVPGQTIIAPTVTLPAEGAATATLDVPMLTALVDVNVRKGPGVIYDTDGFLLQDEMVLVVGRDPQSSWWKIECPPRADGPECWVSGRAQYTAVNLSEAVPVAEVPPTPTPQPQDIGPVLAYVDGGRLFVRSLNTGQSPITAGDPVQLSERNDVLELAISPNGRYIAYLAGNRSVGELHVMNIDGSNAEPLVSVTDLPVAGAQAQPETTALIDQFAWRPDSQALYFNTRVINPSGPGGGSQEDLWQVTLAGESTQLFAPGSGAGVFAVSSGGQILMSRRDAILRVGSAGSEAIIQFTPINTASEAPYYPQPQWTTDGQRALVAIPSSDPLAVDAQATLWQIPISGAAMQLGSISGNILPSPIMWSPDGNRLAYVLSGQSPLLLLAGTGGQDLSTYHSDPALAFLRWGPDSIHFLYSGSDFYGIGQPGQSPKINTVATGLRVVKAEWLTGDAFVLAIGSRGAWTLTSGTVDGGSTPLQPLNATQPVFDVWMNQ